MRSDTPSTKADIIELLLCNPVNRVTARLSVKNQHLLGFDNAALFTKRYHYELQRCSQFYSLASIFDEVSTKDKHKNKIKNMNKLYSAARKAVLRLFICFK